MRTPEQVAADENLTAAIQAVNSAYFGDAPRLLTDYVVILAHQGVDDDGDSDTTITTLARDNELPLYRIIGLLDVALTRRRGYIGTQAD